MITRPHHGAILTLLLLTILQVHCDDTFDPNGLYKEKMIVYGVMTTASDTQYVRVYSTYPAGGQAADTDISDAVVIVKQGNLIFTFRDTTVQQNDTSIYRGSIKVHVAYGLHLESGMRYQLLITSSSHGTATAAATALDRGRLIAYTDGQNNYFGLVTAAANASAFIVRMILDYEILVGGVWLPRDIEIPALVTATGEFVYPSVLPREYNNVSFSATAVEAIHRLLLSQYPSGTVREKASRLVLTQLDEPLYSYYSTANRFPDSGTLRLDEPDYSNIEGALGLFAMSSTVVARPDTILPISNK